ncbi:hypothetical protein EJ03DRAFT_279355 [Teratosphaeria nubilosa]|uniref:tRNA/rRNA methyltransferase SpoU type domain-containing protein n=1 Tax=Teratosphaeria nubilosa TaxID=161662 RepID=A0A6G1KZF5_9PEZI|nr:hypothetical protein EJ03DRAFT_279355 [Teratosphaeria nubilosa]
MAARDTLFAAVTSPGAVSDVHFAFVWRCIQELIAHGPQPFYIGLGYSIWLRFALSGNCRLANWFDPAYWHLLRQGLERGDGERRKQCLAILRRSVYVAVSEKSSDSRLMVSECCTADENILDHYERYCTVFETILLGRYLNQVLACEDDLDLLSSQKSLVKREWLYTLLASALDPKIQDSNRKFIGNWIMRTGCRPDTSPPDFLRFFENNFLPWAQQGSLYTSTLKYRDHRVQCDHGIRLATYLESLLVGPATSDSCRSSIINAMLASITSKNSGNFAYAAVYVLEGLERAFGSTPPIRLTEMPIKTIAGLSSSPTLPEVARDYLRVFCSNILGHQREQMERPTDPPSRRDLLEKEAIEKCHKLRKALQDSGEVLDVHEPLQDIFSDLEYLEYPKSLLMMMPALILDPRFIRLASTSTTLAGDMALYVQKMQKLSETRVYLMPPLVQSIRSAVFLSPAAADLISLADVIISYTESLPEPSVDMKLEESTITLLQSSELASKQTFTYEHYFGDRRSVGIATLLDLISRLGRNHASILQDVLNRIVQRWAKQRNPPPTVGSWKSTLQLQTIILASEQLSQSWTAEQTGKYLRDLHYMLAIEPLPRYRYLLSWVVTRLYLRTPELQEKILLELTYKDHHSNPKYLASLMKIGVMLATAKDSREDFASKLISTLIPLAASSKVIIRHEAQWQIPGLTDHARTKGWSGVMESSAYMALDEYIRSLERFDDPPLERQLDRFDPMGDHNMTNLVQGNWFCLDTIERSTCSREDFEVLFEQDAKSALRLPASCIELGAALLVVRTGAATTSLDAHVAPAAESMVPSKAGESRALQTKGTAYLIQDDNATQGRPRNDIIVVASLVDNPYNLGGLSRVSEIFGASEMHLQNQNVTSNKDFTAVSVSSHLHFPILQLSAAKVATYLSEKRSEGWSIVCIEQTDRSVVLGSKECVLPEKVVLVIGSEKEGIPAVVLGECDLLVEIPQQGVTRSLNVQTAAGIVLFEYARQRRVRTAG